MSESVSPVISVILLVAITIVLAAIFGAFVFEMTGGAKDVAETPTQQLEIIKNCDDRVVCFSIGTRMGCFFNETFLLDKYCPVVP